MFCHPPTRVTSALAALLTLAVVAAGSAHAGPVLDQVLDPGPIPTSNAGFDNHTLRAQTFTVGLAGTLAEIDVDVEVFLPIVGNLVMEVRPTDANGFPAVTGFLAQRSVPATSVPGPLSGGGFVAFDVSSSAIPVTVGEKLAIVLYSDTPNGPIYGWLGTYPGDPYPAGSNFVKSPSDTQWLDTGGPNGGDFGFKTYVNPAAVPEPASIALLATALAGLAVQWRRRRK
jgi:PEP-CTERM motif